MLRAECKASFVAPQGYAGAKAPTPMKRDLFGNLLDGGATRDNHAL